MEKSLKKERYDEAYHVWRVSKILGAYPTSNEHFVSLYAGYRTVNVHFNGLMVTQAKGAAIINPDSASLGRDLRLFRDRERLTQFRDKSIDDALNHWIEQCRQQRLKDAFNAITTPPSVCSDQAWIDLASAVCDPSVASVQYVVAVMKAQIWQIKRKLADDPAYPVHDHVMGILAGPQGAGKSALSMRLFEPISDLVAPTNFTEITDERNFDLWNYPVLFLDEMEAADRSDVEAIKNAITRSIKSGRPLYTNTTATIRVRSTFWGCTNGTLGDKIVDTTGLRRFAPITVKHAPNAANMAAGLPVVDWAVINSMNYLALWQSVDHRAAHPLKSDPAIAEEWAAICEAERNQDSVEVWLRQVERDGVEIVLGKAHLTSELYSHAERGYAAWCRRHGYAPVAAQRFGKRMANFSRFAWYPFEPPTRTKRGMGHVLKQYLKRVA